MKEIEHVESIYNKYLKKHQEGLVNELILLIKNEHSGFVPYKSNPKHYIISIYDPLELYYVLLGKKNLGINMKFEDEPTINKELVYFFDLNIEDEDSIYNPKIVEQKRKIEYDFLRRCLNEVQSIIGQKIQLYITQHVTEISYDISNTKTVDPEYLWENLEK